MAQRASLPMGPFMLSRARPLHESQLACDVCGDIVPPAVRGVEGHHAEGIQHQIHGAVPAAGKRQHCVALGYGTHARLRAGIAEAPLRAAAPLVSSATLRRNASMRLTTRCGGAKVFLRSGTAPACLAFRCASRASSSRSRKLAGSNSLALLSRICSASVSM